MTGACRHCCTPGACIGPDYFCECVVHCGSAGQACDPASSDAQHHGIKKQMAGIVSPHKSSDQGSCDSCCTLFIVCYQGALQLVCLDSNSTISFAKTAGATSTAVSLSRVWVQDVLRLEQAHVCHCSPACGVACKAWWDCVKSTTATTSCFRERCAGVLEAVMQVGVLPRVSSRAAVSRVCMCLALP